MINHDIILSSKKIKQIFILRISREKLRIIEV